MGGFANDASGNDIMYADNVDFTGSSPESRQITTDGELLIGSTAAPNIRTGTLTSPGATVTIGYSSPNITLEAGTSVPTTFTADFGSAVPVANNLNVFGQQANSIPVMFTTGSGDTLSIEDRTRTTALVVDPSSTLGIRGTFTTIQSAITAASSGQTIFIRPGSYVESLTLKAGVNLVAYSCDGQNGSVSITGQSSATFAGSCSLSGIRFIASASPSILITGSSATVINCINCFFSIEASGVTSFANQSSSASSQINLLSCNGNIATSGGGISVFQNTNSGSINIFSSYFTNSGGEVSSSSCTAGNVTIVGSTFFNPIGCSGTGTINFIDSYIQNSAINTNCLTVNSNGGCTLNVSGSYLDSGTASAIFLTGSNATVNASNCTIKSSNANAIVRSASTPTIRFGNLVFVGTSSVIDATLTQVPLVNSNNAVQIKTPGAYPYTTIPQDAVILVDSSSARTITPLASPTTGQIHRIKDNTGSAAANNITITPSGKNIDGVASFVINTNYGSADIVYNGTQWNVL